MNNSSPRETSHDCIHHPASGNAPDVSVVIPVYNVKDWLAETLDTILAQTHQNWECVCVDDGSTDGSADVVRQYAAKDARIRLVSQQNAGAAAARNHGIDAARGEYLIFVDSDDLITPNLMELCLERMRCDHSDLCAFATDAFYTASDCQREAYSGVPFCEECEHTSFCPRDNADEVLSLIAACPWNKMYRVEFLRAGGLRYPTALKRSEDTPFGVMCVAMAERISCVRESLYLYRQNRPGSQMDTLSSPDVYFCYIDAAKNIWQDMRKRDLLQTYGVGALLVSLGNAFYYLPALKNSLMMRTAATRMRHFVTQGLRELEQLGVEVPPQRREQLESMVRKFCRKARNKCFYWLADQLRRPSFNAQKQNGNG